ncbi:hypothetical protein N7541_002932 [Penicillium brevicompactum]|uniref:Zn(2)-C6 fungal-type domain-containing protein n=1 Tax=Penicillium brevicompactum TaxID=5074 RepID=A0A9W9RKU9_PENBR|nr:hypothetical protein N7541_002932 [Penicillium brevicompactum]
MLCVISFSMSAAQRHRRVYQACEPCREKKVRCELGSADHPSQPPCARCCRERKECFFAASRIRKNTSTKRKAESPLETNFSTSQGPEDVSRGAIGTQNSPNLGNQTGSQTLPEDRHAASALLEGHPRTYHDALTLLSEACEHTEGRGQNEASAPSTTHPVISTIPFESADTTNPDTRASKIGTQDALRAWSSVRFVRGGLFTAEEALDMVDHFYKFQSAFSPVVPECFQDHSQHAALIEEEPILTITILMIGSRYRNWTGPAAVARSYIVHDRIWRYLQRMISRLFWSDDLFVGEFPSLRDPFRGPANTQRQLHTEGWSHGFRTLGTWRKIPIHCTPVKNSIIKLDDATECWMRVATIMKKANELLFASPKYTEDIIRSGHYTHLLRSLEPLLSESIVYFDNAKLAKQTRCILTIEYEYAQLCIFSVALQAVINRNSRNGVSGRLESCPADTSAEENKYLSCTVRAARMILKTVLDDLLPAGSLKYIPVRSYSRILGGTLILLKFPLGDLIEGIANRLQSRLACPPISQAHGINSSPSAAEMDTSHGANDQTSRPQYSIGCSIGQTREARPENEPIDPFDPGPSRSVDGKRDPHLDAWSMWWDDQFSQVNLNHMSWYPTLGLLDGSDLSLSGETTGGAFSNSGSFY